MAPGRVEIRESLGHLTDLPSSSRIAADANISALLANAASSLKAKNSRQSLQQPKPEVAVPVPGPGSASADTEALSASDRYGVLEALVKASPGGCAVLDGGLATELEERGADINDPLWSAKCLLEESSATLVRQVSGRSP